MMSLGGNLSLQALIWQDSHNVNSHVENIYFTSNIPIVLLTMVVNYIAVMVIRKKERNGMNDLIVLDCKINVLLIMRNAFLQSPWFVMNSRPPCLIDQVVSVILLWNRTLPIGIALFRYLMVNHSVFCLNHGGEKNGLNMVKRSIIFLMLLDAVMIGIQADTSLPYLRCIGRQETFR